MKKLLLDENIPVRLREYFSSGFEVLTVQYCGWTSLQNGALLKAMSDEGFDVLITLDKKLSHQQNLEKHRIKVVAIDYPSAYCLN